MRPLNTGHEVATSASQSRVTTFNKRLQFDWRVKPTCEVESHPDICTCLKNFKKIAHIREWLQKKEAGLDKTNGELLFEDIQPIQKNPHKSASTILKSCSLVFSWLVERCHGQLIIIFHNAGFNDAKLRNPRELLTEPGTVLKHDLVKYTSDNRWDFEKLIEHLEESRWEFCPYLLDLDLDVKGEIEPLRNKLYIPFCRQKGVATRGATADVFLAHIQEEFVSEGVKQYLGTPVDDGKYGKCYRLAIKRLSVNNLTPYDQEKRAFDGIRDKQGILRCLGFYSFTDYKRTRDEPVEDKQYNILLEYADMNLHELFTKCQPPQLAEDIYSQWVAFCRVAEAIENFHDFNYEGAKWSGWHSDIKPQNLLLVGGEWKLADYGFAIFHEGSARDRPTVQLKECTRTWGAPETVSVGNDVLQTVDTWSFGCILSVMATWIVSGPDGVSDYERRRFQASKESSRAGYPTDTFHDGEDVFPVIKVWHERLKRTRRRSDNITNRILDIVDNCLLTKDAQARLTSHQLRERLETSLGLRSDGDDRVISNSESHNEVDDANSTGLLSTILGPDPDRPDMPGVELHSSTPNIQATTDSTTPNLLSHDFEGRIQTLDTVSRLGGVPSVDSAPDSSRLGVPRLTNTPAPAPDPLVPVVSSTEEEIMDHAWEAVRTANHAALALRRHLFREHPWIADRTDEDGCTPIMIAAGNNNLEVVNLLVEDSDVSRRGKNQRTVLHHLIWAQHGIKQTSQFVETLEYIIGSESSSESMFSSVTWPDRTTCTPIIASAKEKHLDAIKLLVEHSDLSLCDKDQKTVLHHLIGTQRGVDETPEFLATLRRTLGPNPPPRHIFDLINHPDHLQCTCLALCVSIGRMPRTIRELLRKGALVVDGESGTEHSPLAKAVALQTPTLVQVMLEEGLLDHGVPAELRGILEKTKKEAPTIWRLVKDRVRDAEPHKSSRSILRIVRRSK